LLYEEVDMLPTLQMADSQPAVRISGEEVMTIVTPRVREKKGKDLLVYVHVPFCSSKCHFCDWVSAIPVKDLIAEADVRATYVRGVCEQIRWYGPRLLALGYTPRQVYWGGGTPSRLEAEEFREIASALKEVFGLVDLEQHSLEGSPETMTLEKLQTMRAFGVDRISMGVQSMNDAQLRAAARSHDSERVVQAAALIHQAGFDDFNFDIIAGFPDEKLSVFEESLQRAIDLGPSHFSLYPYRGNSATVMAYLVAQGHARSLAREEMFASYFRGKEMLLKAGYQEYIVGYFVNDPRLKFKGERYYFGLEGDYIGFGPGATSVIGHHVLVNTIPKTSGNGGDLGRYVSDPISVDTCELYTTPEAPHRVVEILAKAVMTPEGINYARFQDLFGCSYQELAKHPLIQGLLSFYEYCGAKFVDTSQQLYVTEETRDVARLTCTIERNEMQQIIAHGKNAPEKPSRGVELLMDAMTS
jgi:coproporphyrinogen III oxidase-like Fe-S oxidoreductase